MERRLTAILAADVAGYSRLMGEDEAGTLTALTHLRKGVIEPLIAKHKGRVVKLMGDGFLVEFQSIVDALNCAVAWQRDVAAQHQKPPLRFRIGLNLGDVISEEGDIYGDGVNVAARLQQVAQPGGICLSATAFEHIGGRVNIAVDDRGEQRLKNIVKPVRVYAVRGDQSEGVTHARTSESLSLADKPSIAVLPFQNMSGEPEQGYFADGVTEDIITELSRFRDLLVIARNSSFQYRGKDIDIRRVGRELDVGYVIEGSIRRAGDRIRITAQLIDAGTGKHLWAERYDREALDLFTLQEEMARSIAATVGGRIEAAGVDRATRADPATLKAYDLILRAKALAFKYTKQANAEAREFARQAMEIHPASAKAQSYVGYTHFMDYVAGWTPHAQESLDLAYEFQKTAVALDEADIEVRWKFGEVLLAMRKFDEASVHFDRALEVNPNDTAARFEYGFHLDCIGRHEEAIEHYDLARRRNPIDAGRGAFLLRGAAYYGARRYREAVAEFTKIVEPLNEVHSWLAASYAQLGSLDQAKARLELFLRGAEVDMAIFPGQRLKDLKSYWRGAMFYRDERDYDHLFDGLRKAGLPE